MIARTSTKTYKYRIHYLLRQLQYEDFEIAMTWLPTHLKITPKTFRDWIYIRSDEKRQIPAEALVHLANFFGIPEIEMFENRPKPAKEAFHLHKSNLL